jgi:hypothetical protein
MAATGNTLPDEVREFMQKDYELKARYLSDHFSRMWTRFNFFLVLESGLSAGLWLWMRETGSLPLPGVGLALVGLASTAVWYAFGAQDRYLVVVYRSQVRQAGRELAQRLGLTSYVPIGDTEQAAVEQGPEQWRLRAISTTRLAAWFPLLVLAYWLVIFGVGLAIALMSWAAGLAFGGIGGTA